MNIALRELTRRTSRFVPALTAISLLVVLLVALGGFLDGLERGQTGVLRAQGDRLLVFSAEAELSPARSRLPEGALDELATVDGVTAVGALSTVPTTASVDGDVRDVVLVGHDLATGPVPAPAADGEAFVDERLARLTGVAVGDTLLLGPDEVPLQVAGLLDDVTAGSPTVWVDTARWLELAGAVDPTGVVAPAVGVVEGTASAAALAVAAEGLAVATVDEAIAADEVVTQQSATFAGIIGVTYVVTLLVVALFFVLLTIERLELYAVLKAVGGRSGDLLRGLALQAVVVSGAAVVLGVVVGVGLLGLLPADLPIVVVPSRVATVGLATIVVAVIGALATLRRILRIDPADAIG
jgi:putative ABC transport system permease protein